ncbi:Macrophage receptor MARCO [Acipenser ruthenus]|uniref:Macrophage receptor MARCO n=1 Tax=Acipenser ruthenus TaxID=7906 RepID=A0A444UPV9_ACIRT|nr:Macrophage receptor MARCO [Acipenser ruthenus]
MNSSLCSFDEKAIEISQLKQDLEIINISNSNVAIKLENLAQTPGVQGRTGQKGEQGIGQYSNARIVGTSKRGRAELFHNGEWGTICNDGWDIKAATVFCRMLGYQQATEFYTDGHGTGPILLDDLTCAGTESSLSACRSGGWKKHNCGHSEDAGVECA